MKTFRLTEFPDSYVSAVSSTIDLFGKGDLIIGPTETAYGLLADAMNSEAIEKLFAVKNRTFDKPCSIFIKSAEELSIYAYVSNTAALQAINSLWPGPVTFILKSRVDHWQGVVSKDKKIGFRCSSHPFIKTLINTVNVPLTATSANLSGEEVDSVEDIEKSLGEFVEYMVIDPELDFACRPSTVVDLSDGKLDIVREGKIGGEIIRKQFENVKID